jgi:hypothetical protein
MALDLIEELDRVVGAFEAAGIEYALCGGLAMAVHAYPRFTDDIDMLVQPEDLSRAVELARSSGFDIPARKMLFGLKHGTPREVQRVSTLDPESGRLISLDLLVVAHDLVPVWEGRGRFPWRDRMITVVSREGLVTMKRIAGRPQDLLDIDVLEGKPRDED